MKATERQVTRETLINLGTPFALVCEYRAGHDARKFTQRPCGVRLDTKGKTDD